MELENPDMRPLKDRIFRANYRGGYFFLDKKNEHIPLPLMTSSLDNTDAEPYLEIAAKIDGAINDFYRLIPEKETYFFARELSPRGEESHVPVRYHSSTHAEIARAYRSEIFHNERWLESQSSPKIGSIQYHKDRSVKIYIQEHLGDIVEVLIGTDDSFFVPSAENFTILIDNLIKAIDNLFTQQGFEPTLKRRKNLISLICGLTSNLIETKGIQNILGTDTNTHKINHPSLVRAAAQGINEDIIRLFYVADTYPKSIEETVELTSMPFDMLYGIWVGREKG